MTKEQERDAKARYPGCPHGWCYLFEQCGTVKCCLHAKYEKERKEADAAARVLDSNDS